MKNILYTIAFILISGSLFCQQETMYTHYLSNRMTINPAYTGTEKGINFLAMHRSQWVSFSGAPTSQIVSASMPFEAKNIGAGISFENDNIGPIKNTGIGGSFSYQLKLKNQSKLSLGLSAKMNVVSAGLTNLAIVNQTDVAFSENIQSKILPNFGLGAYYYSEKFFVGLSVPRLLQNGFYSSTTTAEVIALNNVQRHYYIIGGTTFSLDSRKELEIKPSALLKITTGSPIQLDITTRFVYKKKFSAGLMYRTGDALGVLMGIELFKNFQLGYSYDWSYTNKTFRYNGGSHEVMLKYRILQNKAVASLK